MLIAATNNCTREQNQEARREYLLALLRAGSVRARLAAAELDQIGVALKNRMIDTDTAVRWVEQEFGIGMWLDEGAA